MDPTIIHGYARDPGEEMSLFSAERTKTDVLALLCYIPDLKEQRVKIVQSWHQPRLFCYSGVTVLKYSMYGGFTKVFLD